MGFRKLSCAVLAVMVTMILLMKPNCESAAVLRQVKTNTAYHCSSGLLNGCDDHLIIGNDLVSELEQLMDFNVIRILLTAGKTITQQALNAAEAVVSQKSCPKYKKDTPSYTQCIDKGLKNMHICHKGSVYDRC